MCNDRLGKKAVAVNVSLKEFCREHDIRLIIY